MTYASAYISLRDHFPAATSYDIHIALHSTKTWIDTLHGRIDPGPVRSAVALDLAATALKKRAQ